MQREQWHIPMNFVSSQKISINLDPQNDKMLKNGTVYQLFAYTFDSCLQKRNFMQIPKKKGVNSIQNWAF